MRLHTMADDIKLSADPESTWGATDEYKTAWHEKYGNVTPAASGSKADWVTFATDKGGMDEATAEGMTRDELVDHFGGGGQVYSAPAAANDTLGGGDGAGPATTGTPVNATATTPTGVATGTTR